MAEASHDKHTPRRSSHSGAGFRGGFFEGKGYTEPTEIEADKEYGQVLEDHKPMSLPNKQEALERLKTGFMVEIKQAATNYAAPIFWAKRFSHSAELEANISHGSIFFLQCEGPPFAVTADHVYDAYLKRKQNDPSIACQVLDLRFDPEERLIDRDPTLDIATFRIEEREVEGMGKWIHKPAQWPPLPPEEGKGVYTVGFPAIHRRVLGGNSIEWGVYSLLLTATTVSDGRIVCQFERGEWVDTRGFELPERPPKPSLAGLSGAPLWTLTENAAISWRLGGVVLEFQDNFELLYVRRPDCIKSDGALCKAFQ